MWSLGNLLPPMCDVLGHIFKLIGNGLVERGVIGGTKSKRKEKISQPWGSGEDFLPQTQGGGGQKRSR